MSRKSWLVLFLQGPPTLSAFSIPTPSPQEHMLAVTELYAVNSVDMENDLSVYCLHFLSKTWRFSHLSRFIKQWLRAFFFPQRWQLPGILLLCDVCALSLQSSPTLWDPMDYSQPGSSVHGLLQARILEWVAMPSSKRSFQPRDGTCASSVSLHWQEGSLPLMPPGITLLL